MSATTQIHNAGDRQAQPEHPTQSHSDASSTADSSGRGVDARSHTRIRSLTDRLAQVELSLLFHNLDTRSALLLARCDRALHAAACVPFSWVHAEPPLRLTSLAQLHRCVLVSRVIVQGGVPVSVEWDRDNGSGAPTPEPDPTHCMLQLAQLRVRALDLSAWRGFGDQHIRSFIASHPPLVRSLRRVRVGGYHNQVSSGGLRALCEGLPNLTALSVDHVEDAAAEAEAPMDAEAGGLGENNADDDYDYEPLRHLHLAPRLRVLELRRWLAEELTDASLRHVAQLTGLRRLYLENLESFAAPDLRAFFSSSMARGLQLLSLSHVNFATDNVASAFAGIDRDEHVQPAQPGADEHGVGAEAVGSDARAALDMWRGLAQLESLSLIRCRNIFRIVPQLCVVPNLRTLVIRGALGQCAHPARSFQRNRDVCACAGFLLLSVVCI